MRHRIPLLADFSSPDSEMLGWQSVLYERCMMFAALTSPLSPGYPMIIWVRSGEKTSQAVSSTGHLIFNNLDDSAELDSDLEGKWLVEFRINTPTDSGDDFIRNVYSGDFVEIEKFRAKLVEIRKELFLRYPEQNNESVITLFELFIDAY
jgi:hypothetical protein